MKQKKFLLKKIQYKNLVNWIDCTLTATVGYIVLYWYFKTR